jgi:Holliday junction resolvasome RuvABC endonuclease subunit
MKINHHKQFRIAAVSLSTNGFGYAVMEGERLVEYRNKVFLADKSANSFTHIKKLIDHFQPDILVLHDVNAKGTHRASRIKELHLKVVAFAKRRKLKVVKISGTELRVALLGNPKGTKQEMAELLAKRFPDELVERIPTKRKAWTSENARMDIFDAAGLVVAFQLRHSDVKS